MGAGALAAKAVFKAGAFGARVGYGAAKISKAGLELAEAKVKSTIADKEYATVKTGVVPKRRPGLKKAGVAAALVVAGVGAYGKVRPYAENRINPASQGRTEVGMAQQGKEQKEPTLAAPEKTPEQKANEADARYERAADAIKKSIDELQRYRKAIGEDSQITQKYTNEVRKSCSIVREAIKDKPGVLGGKESAAFIIKVCKIK